MSPRTPFFIGLCSLCLLQACSFAPRQLAMDTQQWAQHLQTTPLGAVALLGEQHDAPEHQQWQLATAQALVQRQQLAAVVLEMADAGTSTQGLPTGASEAAVKSALQWSDTGWPWKAYGPTVMVAVQAGVPVLGGNLPRRQMKDVMQQTQWDTHLPAAAWAQQREAMRTGHCGLLPEGQITPMARIQLAKDARMAQVALAQVQAGKTVLLLAGRGHVLRSVGIPTWLPADVTYTVAIGQAHDKAPAASSERDYVVQTPPLPEQDHCAKLRAQWGSAGATKKP